MRFMMRCRGAITGSAAVLVTACLAVTGAGPAAALAHPSSARPTSATADWPAYLNGLTHSSFIPQETAIKPGNARDLVQKWHFAPSTTFYASPTVEAGAVFIGSNSGWFYKLSETTGHVLHRIFIGTQPGIACQALGVVSTATVAPSPGNRRAEIVYVAGPDGYLYALNASNLSVVWKAVVGAIPSKTVNDYFNYGSPTVAGGRIYIGVSSNCDTPLVRGGIIAFSQATGKKLAEFYTVPKGDVGGSVWSSIAVARNGDLYASTGNGPESDQLLGYSEDVLKLAPTLRLLGKFKIPGSQVTFDSDFGASPVIVGNRYVGACNKNGIFYMLRQSNMKVAWERIIGGPFNSFLECIASPAYNGRYLYFGGPNVTIHGVSYQGSIQERVASTGKLIWEKGVPNGIIGSPSLDGAGVLAVGTFDSTNAANETYLVRASNGTILRSLVQGYDFSQSVFANNLLFTANDSGLYAWRIRGRG
jgi:outer membrane protein assembly factor BamB